MLGIRPQDRTPNVIREKNSLKLPYFVYIICSNIRLFVYSNELYFKRVLVILVFEVLISLLKQNWNLFSLFLLFIKMKTKSLKNWIIYQIIKFCSLLLLVDSCNYEFKRRSSKALTLCINISCWWKDDNFTSKLYDLYFLVMLLLS